MGGVWTQPLKLVDGVWFGLDDEWVGPATEFWSGWGYTRYDLPDTGLEVKRTDFVPDGRRGALFGLEVTNPGAARTVELTVNAHSELMGHYPWGFTGVTPNASDNLPDEGIFDEQNLVFSDQGALPGAPVHDYTALVGTALTLIRVPSATSSGARSSVTAVPAPSPVHPPSPSRRSATTAVRPRHRWRADLHPRTRCQRAANRVARGGGVGRGRSGAG